MGTAAVDGTICFVRIFETGKKVNANGYHLGRSPDESVAIQSRPSETATKDARPVAPRPTLLHNRSTNQACTTQRVATENEQDQKQQAPRMGRGIEGGFCGPENEVQGTSDRERLDVCAEDQGHGMESEIQTLIVELTFRPCEIVRLLNSTPLGKTINDRQLYRHRQKAPAINVDGKYVNLVKYCAWMVLERHKPKSLRQGKSNIRGCQITLIEIRELLQQQNFRCALTGQVLTPDNFVLDHIIPVAHGGTFSIDNCQLVTKEVNRAKHTMSQADFLAMCQNVVRHQANLGNRRRSLINKDRPLLDFLS